MATKRKIRNDTPKMPRARKSGVVYIRLDIATIELIRKVAIDRGRPHTFASVAGELLAGALKMTTDTTTTNQGSK